jgi:DNA-binding NtrC family response regulator
MKEEDFLKGKNILLVDDEPDILDVLEELLSDCIVAKAATFDNAKALLENNDFDIAILDIMGVDGYTLLEIANKHDVLAVMLTAHALSPENVVKSFKGGAASYLPKEEMSNIRIFLNDILEAKTKGKHLWWRWFDRLDSYCEGKFGSDWKDGNKEFWEKFPIY